MMPRRDVLTERLTELLGVDDNRAGLSSSEDAFVESRVESRVGVRVVGCSQRQDKASKQASKQASKHKRESAWIVSTSLLKCRSRMQHAENLLVAG